jgi:hypothetical protein
MTAKLTRLAHKIVIQLHLVAESWSICSSRSRRPVRRLLDKLSYGFYEQYKYFVQTILYFTGNSSPLFRRREDYSNFVLNKWKINRYGLDDRGSGVRFPVEPEKFSLLHRVQTGSGAHLPSYPMVTGGYFPGNKAAGAWSWPLTSL